MRRAVLVLGGTFLLLALPLLGGCTSSSDVGGGTYTVAFDVAPPASGTVSGQGTFDYDDTTTIEAVANAGYEFSGFTGDLTGSTNPLLIAVRHDYSGTAHFVRTYTVGISVSPAGAGTTSGTGTYREWHTIPLHATAAAGYEFSGWSYDINFTDNPHDLTIDGNYTIIAEFRQPLSGWAWMNGPFTSSVAGVYGELGVADPANCPGGREFPVGWSDSEGNFWMFGGYGYNDGYSLYFADLWKFDAAAGAWSWMAGPASLYPVNISGIYGTLGTGNPANYPGDRKQSCGASDSTGNLWLFGGLGTDGSAAVGDLNDLWKFDTAAGEWVWVSGSKNANQMGNYGAPPAGPTLETPILPVPGGRKDHVGWTDPSGDFWVFGGYGYNDAGGWNYLNDLWKFDPAGGGWSFMAGSSAGYQPAVWGTVGVADPANTPGGTIQACGASDSSGNLWLFGGYGLDKDGAYGYFSHLWKYDTDASSWTFVAGPSAADMAGVYGTREVANPANFPGGRSNAVAWTDTAGDFWLSGGYGYDVNGSSQGILNDLWKFDVSAGQWSWMAGSKYSGGSAKAVHGSLGEGDPSYTPGSRSRATGAATPGGKLWLFGGSGYSPGGSNGWLSDLWLYAPASPTDE
jgi:N-acetylneuraminic acid mutarotase